MMKDANGDDAPIFGVIVSCIGGLIAVGLIYSTIGIVLDPHTQPGAVVPCDSYHKVIAKERIMTPSGEVFTIQLDSGEIVKFGDDHTMPIIDEIYWEKTPLNVTGVVKRTATGVQFVPENISRTPNPEWGRNYCVVGR